MQNSSLTISTFYLFSGLLFLCLLSTCSEAPTCKLGKPTAIFPPDLATVSSREFSEKNNVSTENIIFSNGIQLEILQDGCDFVRQEFRFSLAESADQPSASFWVERAANLFHFMADQTKALQDFHLWAGAIEAKAPQLKLGERTPLDGPFTLKIDKIKTGDTQVLLTVELSNAPQ